MQHFREQLDAALRSPAGEHATLISGTSELRRSLEEQMREGRDRLLELNSHDPEQGEKIISTIRREETPEQLMDFAELLFDRIGISQDYHSETTHLLKPTEMLITGQLPGLDEDGTVVSFDRETALSRDDVLFLTREHPLLREAMAVVVSSELGNSALGTIKHPKIPAGTVLLEASTVSSAWPTTSRWAGSWTKHRFGLSSTPRASTAARASVMRRLIGSWLLCRPPQRLT